MSELRWRKSSHSGGGQEGGECVEIADAPDGGRFIRDSKNRGLAPHYFNAGEWAAFVAGVKDGEFD